MFDVVDVCSTVDSVLFERHAEGWVIASDFHSPCHCLIEGGSVEEEIVYGGVFDVDGDGNIIVCSLEVNNVRRERGEG